MTDTVVVGNRATLAAALPAGVGLLAIAGAIHLSDQVPTGRISNSAIVGNTTGMTNSVGNATAFSGGLHVDEGVDLQLRGSAITSNHVFSATLGSSPGDAEADSGAGEIAGTLSGDRLTRNTVSAISAHGHVDALAGAAILGGTFSAGEVGNNRVRAIAPHGTVTAEGGGFTAGDQGLALRASTVHANSVNAVGSDGSTARGGGIADFAIPNGSSRGFPSARFDTRHGQRGDRKRGRPPARRRSRRPGRGTHAHPQPDVHNRPDQCVGLPVTSRRISQDASTRTTKAPRMRGFR